MEYKVGKEIYKVPENEIDKLVDCLGISIIEACELWLADNGKIENKEQDTLDKNAHGGKRHYERSKARSNAPKERKVDENKKDLLKIIQKALENVPELVITGQKNEVELYFSHKDAKYTLKLTKHRPPK